MKKIIYTSLLFIFTFYAATAQNGFNKKNIFNTFSAFDSAILDGDKVVCVGSYGDTIWKTFVAVLDTNGNIIKKDIYNPTIKGTGRARSSPMKITRTSDGGYVFVSIIYPNYPSTCYKLDKYYNLEYRFDFEYNPKDVKLQFPYQMLVMDDGYVFAGYFDRDNYNFTYLLKTDKQGKKLWEKEFGYKGEHSGYDNIFIDKGIIRLKYYIESSPNYFSFLVDIDTNGNIVNEKILKKYTHYGVIKVLKEGGYLCTTWEQEPSLCKFCGSNYLVKADTNLNTIWKKKFGYLGRSIDYDVREMPDGNYIYTSNTYKIEKNKPSDPSWATNLLYKFTPNGDSIWARLDTMYSKTIIDDLITTSGAFYCLVPLPSNNIIAVGYGNKDKSSYAWIAKVTKDGCMEETDCQLTATKEVSIGVTPLVYPNPANDIFHFDLEKIEKDNLNISIYDNQGKFLFQKEVLDKKIETIDMSQYPNGFYFYQIKTKDYQVIAAGKVIIAR